MVFLFFNRCRSQARSSPRSRGAPLICGPKLRPASAHYLQPDRRFKAQRTTKSEPRPNPTLRVSLCPPFLGGRFLHVASPGVRFTLGAVLEPPGVKQARHDLSRESIVASVRFRAVTACASFRGEHGEEARIGPACLWNPRVFGRRREAASDQRSFAPHGFSDATGSQLRRVDEAIGDDGSSGRRSSSRSLRPDTNLGLAAPPVRRISQPRVVPGRGFLVVHRVTGPAPAVRHRRRSGESLSASA